MTGKMEWTVGPVSQLMICPTCHQQIWTTVQHEPTILTHLLALVLCIFLCCPCVCLPYCVNSCENANHYCPNCNSFLGTYESI